MVNRTTRLEINYVRSVEVDVGRWHQGAVYQAINGEILTLLEIGCSCSDPRVKITASVHGYPGLSCSMLAFKHRDVPVEDGLTVTAGKELIIELAPLDLVELPCVFTLFFHRQLLPMYGSLGFR